MADPRTPKSKSKDPLSKFQISVPNENSQQSQYVHVSPKNPNLQGLVGPTMDPVRLFVLLPKCTLLLLYLIFTVQLLKVGSVVGPLVRTC